MQERDPALRRHGITHREQGEPGAPAYRPELSSGSIGGILSKLPRGTGMPPAKECGQLGNPRAAVRAALGHKGGRRQPRPAPGGSPASRTL